MNADITFTASEKLYCLHPDADALAVSDQIDARQAQLTALLSMTKGAAGEVFRTMADPLQESYMWACEMLAMEVQELLSARADMDRGAQ